MPRNGGDDVESKINIVYSLCAIFFLEQMAGSGILFIIVDGKAVGCDGHQVQKWFAPYSLSEALGR